jgi:hypothetical protein
MGNMSHLDTILAMKDDALVPIEVVAEICSICAEKMQNRGLRAMRASIIKEALRDSEVKNAVRTRQKGLMKMPNVTQGTP